jgi:hypothetical protein
MSILDIIDKDKLKEILTEYNFEIIKKIYNEKTNEQKLEEVKKEIDKKYSIQEYIITEINITRGGNTDTNTEEWCKEYFNTNEYVKYKYSVKSKSVKDNFELIIIEYNDEPNGGSKFLSFIHMKSTNYVRHSELPYFNFFTKMNNCDFFLYNVLFDPSIRDDDELVDMGFHNSDLLYLDPIKLIHEKFQGVEDFYYCEHT